MSTSQLTVPQTMKAAVMHDIYDIRIEERPVPEPADDEVLVRVMAVGICGSDLHYFEHGRIGPYVVKQPIVLGHECSGIVAACGRGVKTLKPGDRVAVEPGVTCGTCDACKTGRYNLCPDVRFLATPPYDGAFVQYIAIRHDFVFPIPDELSFEEAALNEPFSVGIHAAKRSGLRPGSTLAIMGVGPVGLTAIVAGRAFGARDIIVTDLEPIRLEAARKLGATHTINAREEDPVVRIKELTGGRGADVAFETAGNPKALQNALASLRRGGKLSIVGLPPQDEIGLNIPFIADNEIDIYGVFRYANTYPQGISILSSKLADLNAMITDRFELRDTQQAMVNASTNKSASVKTIIYPNGF
ncbi:NAD(P)-dependent alcohol dehydrogenase [Paenibacillus thalictri]|uniref:NAD(P)-dependent alcohol dehydrogenase n=1 Tax=Paenibacillus thalictri TaxID=2527873 RepID=A0A4Q9DQ36_9BACL|nr:NAD(P)-dependent alcohol dehydrogenase [Paenibacillus thalictri]TBL76361.1 NAD(P)-dependent alcohol dehydrogenase [Paenibacillus thalictri]